jgi:putative transposase
LRSQQALGPASDDALDSWLSNPQYLVPGTKIFYWLDSAQDRPDVIEFPKQTGAAFTGMLIDNGIAISMDGKGAWRDNAFVERLWRSVKYEEVYLRACDTASEARASIGRYLDFYNPASQHPSVYVVEENRFC